LKYKCGGQFRVIEPSNGHFKKHKRLHNFFLHTRTRLRPVFFEAINTFSSNDLNVINYNFFSLADQDSIFNETQ
jgi:hypothetical protein